MSLSDELRARATYANVTATLALFVALGGGSFAVAALSGSEKTVVKKIAKKQADKRITARAATLSVGHAGSADTASDAAHASSADSATNAGHANTADQATNANTAGQATTATTANDANALAGVGPNGYVRTPTEATRLIGTPGNPVFESFFDNKGQGASAGFYKDQFGIVHLQGDLDPPGASGTIFTLPPGYRPVHNGAQGPVFVVRADAGIGLVDVRADGGVRALASFNDNLSLNGVTFRASD